MVVGLLSGLTNVLYWPLGKVDLSFEKFLFSAFDGNNK